MQSAEAARSGGDLVFSVPLKGCEVIFTFCFLEFDTSSLFLSHHLVFYVPLKGCEVILTFFFKFFYFYHFHFPHHPNCLLRPSQKF